MARLRTTRFPATDLVALVFALSLVLLGTTAPVEAQDGPLGSACAPASFAATASTAPAEPFDLEALLAVDRVGDPQDATSTCTAQCWDGSTRTCTGASCTATDSRCKSGLAGSCTGSTGTSSCPPCPRPPCSATVTCDGGGTGSCTGYGNCFAVQGCYAYCERATDPPGGGFQVWCQYPRSNCADP